MDRKRVILTDEDLKIINKVERLKKEQQSRELTNEELKIIKKTIILEEKQKNKLTHDIITQIIGEDIHFETFSELFSFLISDSIFCLYEMIKSNNIYGISYIHNHSWLASSYKKLGDWSILRKYYKKALTAKKGKEASKAFDSKLDNLIGKVEMNDLSPNALYERALSHYYSIYEMHSEGAAYEKVIENMYYLDDNFNDNLYHFCAAMERYQINNKSIQKQIDLLTQAVKSSILNTTFHDEYAYRPESYFL